MGVARFGVLVAIIRMGLAQSPPDVGEIVKKVGDTYRAAKEFELISQSSGAVAVPGRLLAAFRSPNRYRMEGADPNQDNADGTFGQFVMVGDGTTVWIYHPQGNEYATGPGNAMAGEFEEATIGRFRKADDSPARAKFLREEAISINGADFNCYVLTLPVSIPREGASIDTWWVEKRSNHVIREEHDGASIVFTTVKLNEPLPDDLFKFAPPPGARKVEGNWEAGRV